MQIAHCHCHRRKVLKSDLCERFTACIYSKHLFQGDAQVATRRPGRERQVVYSEETQFVQMFISFQASGFLSLRG